MEHVELIHKVDVKEKKKKKVQEQKMKRQKNSSPPQKKSYVLLDTMEGLSEEEELNKSLEEHFEYGEEAYEIEEQGKEASSTQ